MGARLSPQALTNRAVSLKATAQKDWSSDSELQSTQKYRSSSSKAGPCPTEKSPTLLFGLFVNFWLHYCLNQ